MRLLSFVLAAVVSTSALAAEQAHSPRLHNSAMAFAEFWDAHKDKPASEQVAAFKTKIAPVFPGFYSAERHKSMFTPAQYDGLIEGAIKEFPTLRSAYVTKAREFETSLPKYVATFKTKFPDLQLPEDIYVIHSLGEMDGGIRAIDGKSYFIFGVDVMAKFHGNGSESAFFHHELFHVYHGQAAPDCGDAGIWNNLWAEGLAVYASKVLNPAANDKELLLEVPDNMAQRTRAVLPAALAQLESVLDKTDNDTYADLFSRRGAESGLPKRRAYYLGYLVAEEAGKTHNIRDMAKMNCAQAREVVFSTVQKLRANTH